MPAAIAAPNAPILPTITVTDIDGENAVVLDWKAPTSDGGSRILKYRIERKRLGNKQWIQHLATPSEDVSAQEIVPATRIVITEAEQYDDCEFRVFASNSKTEGPPSLPSNVLRIRELQRPPVKPTDVIVSADTETSVKLSWKPGKQRPDDKTKTRGYAVEYRSKTLSKWTRLAECNISTQYVIKNLVSNEEYVARVMAVNRFGESEPVETNEFSPVDLLGVPPDVEMLTPSPIERPEGGEAEVKFRIRNYKSIEIFKRNVRIQTDNDQNVTIKIEQQHHSIIHKNLQLGDASHYTLKVSNKVATVNKSYELRILPKPYVKIINFPVSVIAGDSIVITAEVGGITSTDQITWKKGDVPVIDHEAALVSSSLTTSKLTLLAPVWRRDAGVYTCKVKTKSGEAQESCNIEIFDKPSPPLGPLDVEPVASENSEEPRSNNAVTLRWIQPNDDGGKTMTRYIVYELTNERRTWTKIKSINDITVTECVVDSLMDNIEYSYRVTACNTVGESNPLQSDKAYILNRRPPKPTTSQHDLAPLPPHDLEATAVPATGDFELIWQDENKQPVGYIFETSDKRSKTTWRRIATKRNLTEKRFLLEHSFVNVGHKHMHVRVIAVNESGKESVPSNIVTVQPTIPSRDVSTAATSQVTANAAPAERTKDEDELEQIFLPADTFTVMEEQPVEIEIPYTGSLTRASLVEIVTSTDVDSVDRKMTVHKQRKLLQIKFRRCKRKFTGMYKVRVVFAKTTVEKTLKLIVQSKPGAPEQLKQVTDIEDEKLTFTWQPPSDDGDSPVTNYEIETLTGHRASWRSVQTVGVETETKLALTKPSNEEALYIRVRAVNKVGAGAPTSPLYVNFRVRPSKLVLSV